MKTQISFFILFFAVIQSYISQEMKDSLNKKVAYVVTLGIGEEFSFDRNMSIFYNIYKSEVSLGANATQITLQNGIEINKWQFDVAVLGRKIKDVVYVSSYQPNHPHLSRYISYDFWGFGGGINISREVYSGNKNAVKLFTRCSYFLVPSKSFEDKTFDDMREYDSVAINFEEKSYLFQSNGPLIQVGLVQVIKTKVGNFGLTINASVQPIIKAGYSIKRITPIIGFGSSSLELNRGFLGFGIVYSWKG